MFKWYKFNRNNDPIEIESFEYCIILSVICHCFEVAKYTDDFGNEKVEYYLICNDEHEVPMLMRKEIYINE